MDEWTEDELYELMAEPPGGENHGYIYATSFDGRGDDGKDIQASTKHSLDWRTSRRYTDMQASSIDKSDFAYHGMVAHRGVLHSWEYADEDAIPRKSEEHVDLELLEEGVASFLGEDLDEIRRIYGPGGLNEEDLAIRKRMDTKFLEISEMDGNLLLLAKVLGFGIKKNSECRVMTNALKRARKARG